MKVKELKELLTDLPDDYEVVIAGDGEGNNFSPLADIGAGLYEPDSTWSGEFNTTRYEGGFDEDEEEVDIPEEEFNAICLWHVN